MEFKIGDVVCLKSGGPSMTIIDIITPNFILKAKCSWIDEENHIIEHSFVVDALKYVSKE